MKPVKSTGHRRLKLQLERCVPAVLVVFGAYLIINWLGQLMFDLTQYHLNASSHVVATATAADYLAQAGLPTASAMSVKIGPVGIDSFTAIVNVNGRTIRLKLDNDQLEGVNTLTSARLTLSNQTVTDSHFVYTCEFSWLQWGRECHHRTSRLFKPAIIQSLHTSRGLTDFLQKYADVIQAPTSQVALP